MRIQTQGGDFERKTYERAIKDAADCMQFIEAYLAAERVGQIVVMRQKRIEIEQLVPSGAYRSFDGSDPTVYAVLGLQRRRWETEAEMADPLKVFAIRFCPCDREGVVMPPPKLYPLIGPQSFMDPIGGDRPRGPRFVQVGTLVDN